VLGEREMDAGVELLTVDALPALAVSWLSEETRKAASSSPVMAERQRVMPRTQPKQRAWIAFIGMPFGSLAARRLGGVRVHGFASPPLDGFAFVVSLREAGVAPENASGQEHAHPQMGEIATAGAEIRALRFRGYRLIGRVTSFVADKTSV
jgi:hypothetical protein